VDQQCVVYLVVAKYVDRLERMLLFTDREEKFVNERFAVTGPYVEYLPEPRDVTPLDEPGLEGRKRCARRNLMSVGWRRGNWTPEGEMIYMAALA